MGIGLRSRQEDIAEQGELAQRSNRAERRAANKAAKRQDKQAKKTGRRLPGGGYADPSLTNQEAGPSKRASALNRWRARNRRMALPKHTGTTAHQCSLYPWGVHPSLGYQGVFLGEDLLGGGGAFCFDQFEAYGRFADEDQATNTNMLIMGMPGRGKSALMKTLLYRMSAIYGADRFIAIVDVKGEYLPLAEVLGMSIVRLSPSGSVRVNPLEVRTTGEEAVRRRAAMVRALSETVLDRTLTQIEQRALWGAVATLAPKEGMHPTLADLVAGLGDHTSDEFRAGASDTGLEIDQYAKEIADLRLALESLVQRQLRGMFDGQSTVQISPESPGVVIDISEVQHDDRLLALVMMAATAWLHELMFDASPGRMKIQVLDECWKMVGSLGTARYLQECWKLGRTKGMANVGLFHKPVDLGAQSADGSSTSKISSGLLADTAITVSFTQTAKDLAEFAEVVGWNETERELIGQLGRGESFWKIGSRSALLDHRLAEGGIEAMLCNTDGAIGQQA